MVTIDPTAVIDVDELVIGEGTVVRAHAEIYGRRVVLGRECFIDEYAVIGGGSASVGELVAGDWLHLGMGAQINTARPVHVGDEVGIGIGSRVFTHGAYLSEWDGFPVTFGAVTVGSRVWLPQATVMPGVTIGDDVVVAAGSVVTAVLPCGVLAAGAPARVVREQAYPATPADRQGILERICAEADVTAKATDAEVVVGDTMFDVALRTITGPVTSASERLRQQLRRHGIRFRYAPAGADYGPWT
jgi:acetyltransferase-like isoleucine patch superfamily enzyme